MYSRNLKAKSWPKKKKPSMVNKPTKKLNKNLKLSHKNLLINPKSRGR